MIHQNQIPQSFFLTLAIIFFALCTVNAGSPVSKDTIIIKQGFRHHKISREWKNALATRMSRQKIAALPRLNRKTSSGEQAWLQLIKSKSQKWNQSRDSLAVPFEDVETDDTVFVLLGLGGHDDGFTYGPRTVCLDLTALVSAYGNAELPENDNRIDRIFSHEYTHLLHKKWAEKNQLLLPAYRDTIFWECFYEGMGMYRSLNPKWLPVEGKLPQQSKTTLENLYPVFVDRLIAVETSTGLSAKQKEELNKNLSRGNVNQKWGAFTVAIWLALEANGEDSKLHIWISKGPASVIQLAKKYLPPHLEKKFSIAFP